MNGFEDKVFDFWKQEHAADIVNKYEAIAKYVKVNYKHDVPNLAIFITKNMDKPTINDTEVPEDASSGVDIFIR